ncbi:MAG: hypothetical protein IJH79_06525 [Lentisphaeria bacterium]|nr:hypothetical protein [Lentisphaeria bacterium]
MKKELLTLLLAGCGLFGISALDLQLKDGTTLPDIQFVRPALRGVTLITTNRFGKSFLVTVPFSAVSLPSLYALRSYLMRNNLPAWDSPDLNPPAWSASISALNLYLRRYVGPSVILGNDAVFIRLGAPGSWQDAAEPPEENVIQQPDQ